jgi:hypothetical protein
MARTAVVAGTATTVSNRVSRRQANKWAREDAPAPEPQYAPPPPAAPAESRIDKLTKLGELKAQGVLTDEEFAQEKARILNS